MRTLKTYAPYLVLTVVIMLPLLAPGYILTLDAVFVPHVAAPSGAGNDYIWQLFLHLLSIVVPSQIIEKVIFMSIVLMTAIGMHQLVGWLRAKIRADKTLARSLPAYAAGVLFAVNPYTYDRFMAGQYGVLLGYALLPFAVRFLLEFAETPDRNEVLRLGGIAVLLSIVSIPTLGEFAIAAACVLGVAAWQQRVRPRILKRYVVGSLVALGLFLVLSSYWLVPLVMGKGAVATSLRQFNTAHTAAFATVGSSFASKLASVLRLQGFWAEPHRLFVLPQDSLPGWGTVRLLVWALVAAGAVVCWRRSRQIAATFLALGACSALLAAGLFSSQLTRIGYREPQKFVGLLALVFAVFVAFGTARFLAWAQARSETAYAVVASGTLLIILIFTPTMYWGFAGQLHVSQYPPGWFSVNSYLNRQSGTFNTVFLPWHEYMSFSFAGRIIANPAPRFFDQPVISSNDPELGHIMPPAAATATKVGWLVHSGKLQADLAVQLARYNVRYIVVAKEYDYQHYSTVMRQSSLVLIRDTPTISLFQNTAWKGGK